MPRSATPDTEHGSPEKEAAMHLERRPANGLSFEDEEFLANFSDDERKAVLKKVCTNHLPAVLILTRRPGRCRNHHIIQPRSPLILQWRLVPMLVLLYLVAYIDKTNIGEWPSDVIVLC